MIDEKNNMISPITENQILSIDEEKLPQLFSEQVHFLEKANQEFSKAEEKEKKARKKVEVALTEADTLIEAAKGIGGHTAQKKKILWFEWSSKKDEIEALKDNLKEIIEHSEDSAEAQKKLAEVQASLMESQTAILQVQKAHMEYQRQIANATKFVFGLSAYNMATSQSILVKLKAVLAGASEEQLGELAQQQLFLALDQIRNQESLITRINEIDGQTEALNQEIEKKQKEIDSIALINDEQSKQISENTETLAKHQEELMAQRKKDEEFSQMFAAQDLEDEAQDQKIAENANKIKENKRNVESLSKQDKELEKQIQKISDSTNKEIENFKEIVEARLTESDKQIKEELEKSTKLLKTSLSQIQCDFDDYKKASNEKFNELENKYNNLQSTVNKRVWKIAISVAIGTSLILNFLQIFDII